MRGSGVARRRRSTGDDGQPIERRNMKRAPKPDFTILDLVTVTVDPEEFNKITRSAAQASPEPVIPGIFTLNLISTLSTLPKTWTPASLNDGPSRTPIEQGKERKPPSSEEKETSTPISQAKETAAPTSQEKEMRTPKSKEPLSITDAITGTIKPSRSSYTSDLSASSTFPTSETYQSLYGGPRTGSTGAASVSSKATPTGLGTEPELQDMTGIIIGIVAAMGTTVVICLIGLVFFCRNKRRKNKMRNEGAGEKTSIFGRKRRSASQASGDSRRPILASNIAPGTNEKLNESAIEDDIWKHNDSVHHPPFQHIPRNLEVEADQENKPSEQTNKAVSPGSVETPLPELPVRPQTAELRNSHLQHRPSIPVDLRIFSSNGSSFSGLTRPKTSHGNRSFGMAPVDPGLRRASTRAHAKESSAASPRGRAFSMASLESDRKDAPPLPPRDSKPQRANSRSKPDLKRQASQTSLRYTVFPKTDKRVSLDNLFTNHSVPPTGALPVPPLPNSQSKDDLGSHPGIKRSASDTNIHDNGAVGIPNLWNNVDQQSPKASPTRPNANPESPVKESSSELRKVSPEPNSRRFAKLRMTIPDSPGIGPLSTSTVDTTILNAFKQPPFNETAPPLPERSTLRDSDRKRSGSKPPSPIDENDDDGDFDTNPDTPTNGRRRRNTGFRPERLDSESPPPAIPNAPPPTALLVSPSTSHGDENGKFFRDNSSSIYSTSTMNFSRSNMTMSMGSLTQITTDFNTRRGRDPSRPYSCSTNGSASRIGMNERVPGWTNGISFSPIFEARDSVISTSEAEHAEHEIQHFRADSDVLSPAFLQETSFKSPEEAVDSFFQLADLQTQSVGAQPTEDDVDTDHDEDVETEPKLARYMSITSTSTTRPLTINHKSSGSTISSRHLSENMSTVRTRDLRLSQMGSHMDNDINNASLSRSSSISISPSHFSVHPLPLRESRDLQKVSAEANTTSYSPTLSMLNFYSSSSPRYSNAPAPPTTTSPSSQSTRASLALRRKSHQLPHISIPQPKLYIHPNTQLDITNNKDSDDEENNNLTANHIQPGGSLSSATSPLSFTTADSGNGYSPALDGPYAIQQDAVLIPTPQIYSSSQEDITSGLSRQSSYVFPKRNDLINHSSSPNSESVQSLNPAHLQTHPYSVPPPNFTDLNKGASATDLSQRDGRTMSLKTDSTLDKSSFRDMEVEKISRSGSYLSSSSLETASDENSTIGDGSSYDGRGGFDLEIENNNTTNRNGAAPTELKTKISGFVGKERGRSRERRLA